MNTITMGNDEFILYIRKNYPNCRITNDRLGSDIWKWIRENDDNAKQVKKNQPCLWDSNGSTIDSEILPKTATQFEFQRNLLSKLYDKLDEIGIGK